MNADGACNDWPLAAKQIITNKPKAQWTCRSRGLKTSMDPYNPPEADCDDLHRRTFLARFGPSIESCFYGVLFGGSLLLLDLVWNQTIERWRYRCVLGLAVFLISWGLKVLRSILARR